MTLYEKLKQAIFESLKQKKTCAEVELFNYYSNIIAVYRSVLAKADTIVKERKVEAVDAVVQEAAAKELKELKQTLSTVPIESTLYQYAQVQAEALKDFLPQMLTGEALKAEIDKLVTDNAFTNFGAAMKHVNTLLKGSAEGKEIADILKSYYF